jgi:hypothetical protein
MWLIWCAYWIWGRISGQSQAAFLASVIIVMLGLSLYVLFEAAPTRSNATFWVLGIATSVLANLLTGLALPYIRRRLNIDEE